MRIRSVLAGVVVAGVATVGTAAAAATNQPTKPRPATATRPRQDRFCDTWVPRLPSLEDRREKDETRIDDLTKAIEAARDHHREDLAERLERVRDGVQRDRDRIVALEAHIHARCDR
jgi:hypothetical protein